MNSIFNPKTFLLLFSSSLVFSKAQAQTTTKSIGFSMPVAWRTYEVTPGNKNTDGYYLAMFTYGLRRNLSETDNSSFSLGGLASAGAGIYTDISGPGFLFSGDLQFWGDYNIGMGAVPEPAKNTGWYFGAGAGVSIAATDAGSVDQNSGVSFGPMARAGFRFGLYSPKKDMYKAFTIGLYYKHGLESAKWRTAGFHILTDL